MVLVSEDFKQFRWNSTLQEWSKESVPLRVEMLGLSIIIALFGILLVQTMGEMSFLSV